jgi:uncharacterized protein (DUF433 family)
MEKQLNHTITVDPDIKFGKPIIKGTRVAVDLIVGKIAGGMTIEEVMAEYDLTRDQVFATLQHAAEIIEEEELMFA